VSYSILGIPLYHIYDGNNLNDNNNNKFKTQPCLYYNIEILTFRAQIGNYDT